jgi:hypothetical protein
MMQQERGIGLGHNQPPQETALASWLHGAEALIRPRDWPSPRQAELAITSGCCALSGARRQRSSR